jgi:hypothetical protein
MKLLDARNPEAARMEIAKCLDILGKTERGRKVAADLYELLDGPISNLDGNGWAAVYCLLHDFEDGYQGSTLEGLEQFRRQRK